MERKLALMGRTVGEGPQEEAGERLSKGLGAACDQDPHRGSSGPGAN